MRGISIAEAGLPVTALPRKTGRQVFDELGGRLLVKYLTRRQVGRFRGGASGTHWLTPTAYSPSEACVMLLTPAPDEPREYALLLDPRRIEFIYGPQRVAGIGSIQYILTDGFPPDAIVVPGAPGARWEVVVQ